MCSYRNIKFKQCTKFISTCSNCVKGFRISQAANNVIVLWIRSRLCSIDLLARTCFLKRRSLSADVLIQVKFLPAT